MLGGLRLECLGSSRTPVLTVRCIEEECLFVSIPVTHTHPNVSILRKTDFAIPNRTFLIVPAPPCPPCPASLADPERHYGKMHPITSEIGENLLISSSKPKSKQLL